MIAPARLARILKPCKARCQTLDHAARPRLHPTGNGQHVPQSTARHKVMREPWGETVIVARVGMKTTRRFMILTPAGQPAWPHEPLGSLSDVGWSLRAHGWHLVTPEPAGQRPHSRPGDWLGC